MQPHLDLVRVRFLCTRLTRLGEAGLPDDVRLCFMEGKVVVLPYSLAGHFALDDIIEVLEPIQPNEPIKPEEIEWSYGL